MCDYVSLANNITRDCNVDIMGNEVFTPCATECIAVVSYCLMYCYDFFVDNNIINKLTDIFDFCFNKN